jgi:hypothetical protein
VSNVCVYSFADASGVTKYVDDAGDFYYNGTWSASGTYTASPLNAVNYGAALYMCIRNNVGDNPQRVITRFSPPASWSIMSLLYEYQCSGTEVGTAADAYRLAESGTNIAWAAYELAQIGTNTGSAAYALAQSAGSAANEALGILSVRANGTFTVWASGSEGGTANIELIFVNGILQTYAPA